MATRSRYAIATLYTTPYTLQLLAGLEFPSLRLRVRSDDLLKTAAGKILALFGLHFAHFTEKLFGPRRVSSLFAYLSKLVDGCLVSGLQPDGKLQLACGLTQTVLPIKQFTQKLVRL